MTEALRHEMRKAGEEDAWQTFEGLYGNRGLVGVIVEPSHRGGGTPPWEWPISIDQGKVMQVEIVFDAGISRPATVLCLMAKSGRLFTVVADVCRVAAVHEAAANV